MAELQSQVSLNNPYVTGGCLASSMAQGVEKEVAQNMYVAFDRTCIRKLDSAYFKPIAPVRDSWIDRNKVWVISAVAMTLGAGYYLRDKEVELSNPFR